LASVGIISGRVAEDPWLIQVFVLGGIRLTARTMIIRSVNPVVALEERLLLGHRNYVLGAVDALACASVSWLLNRQSIRKHLISQWGLNHWLWCPALGD